MANFETATLDPRPRGSPGRGLCRSGSPGWEEHMAIESGAPATAEGSAQSNSGMAKLFGVFLSGDAAPANRIAAGIALLTLLRFALGVFLPLSFDEAYYWLWSKHLAASYFDHPPAIAYAIRFGTMLL